VQRFLDAAVELLNSAPGKEFTVQEVVERSGQSLRSFYQHFAGKYELLLALFEESIRATAEHLRQVVAGTDDPLERLRLFTLEYYRLCRPGRRPVVLKKTPHPLAIADFAQRLLTDHPNEAARAFSPLVSLFRELLDAAAEAGAIRPDLDHTRVAGVVLQAIMFNAFALTIAGGSTRPDADDPEGLWDVLLHGIAPRR
jgi:AcrR family transcriptional regulator